MATVALFVWVCSVHYKTYLDKIYKCSLQEAWWALSSVRDATPATFSPDFLQLSVTFIFFYAFCFIFHQYSLWRISLEVWWLRQGCGCFSHSGQIERASWRYCWESQWGQPKSVESYITVRGKSSSQPLSDLGHQGDYYSTSYAINCFEQVEKSFRFDISSIVFSH